MSDDLVADVSRDNQENASAHQEEFEAASAAAVELAVADNDTGEIVVSPSLDMPTDVTDGNDQMQNVRERGASVPDPTIIEESLSKPVVEDALEMDIGPALEIEDGSSDIVSVVDEGYCDDTVPRPSVVEKEDQDVVPIVDEDQEIYQEDRDGASMADGDFPIDGVQIPQPLVEEAHLASNIHEATEINEDGSLNNATARDVEVAADEDGIVSSPHSQMAIEPPPGSEEHHGPAQIIIDTPQDDSPTDPPSALMLLGTSSPAMPPSILRSPRAEESPAFVVDPPDTDSSTLQVPGTSAPVTPVTPITPRKTESGKVRYQRPTIISAGMQALKASIFQPKAPILTGVVTDDPFRFPAQPAVQGMSTQEFIGPPPPPLPPPNQVGVHPLEMDVQLYEKQRTQAPFQQYIPSIFSFVPPRRLDQFSQSEVLTNASALWSEPPVGDPLAVRCINITNPAGVPNKLKKRLGKLLSRFANVEVAIIRGLGLDRFEGVEWPLLRHLDLSLNPLSKTKDIIALLTTSPAVFSLALASTPMSDKPDFLLRLVAAGPNLKVLNDKPITLEAMATAVSKFGDTQRKKRLPFEIWDQQMSRLPLFTGMRHFQPELVTELRLASMGLQMVHVGMFVNLLKLDVSNNSIAALTGTGLDRLSDLVVLDCTANSLSSKDDLHVLRNIPSLQQLTLANNPLNFNYRLLVIFITRFLKGTDYSPGLLQLDGEDISIELRVAALRTHDKISEQDLELRRWHYNLVATFGHRQVQDASFMASVQVLRLPKCQLSVVDCSSLPALEVLDLSRNDLTNIMGLEKLLNLRCLDLSFNKKLKLSKLLPIIQGMRSLEVASFTDEPLSSVPKSYRPKLLSKLVATTPLWCLDGVPITIDERVQAYKANGTSDFDCAALKFQLAVDADASDNKSRNFHPNNTRIGLNYVVAEVETLIRLNDLALPSDVINISAFSNLRKLNLSGNKIARIEALGLAHCPLLTHLDLSDNQISTPLPDIAQLLDCLSLEVLAIRKNPVCKTTGDRFRLIGLLKRLRDPTLVFQTVDTLVTISERVAAWKVVILEESKNDRKPSLTERKSSVTDYDPREVEPEQFRFKAVVGVATNRASPTSVARLSLQHCELLLVNFAAFTNLQHLSLRSNFLSSLDNTGIETLTSLLSLDLRDNHFRFPSTVAATAATLPLLQSVGLAPMERADSLLQFVVKLKDVNCPLKLLDDQDISIDDIVKAIFDAEKVGQGKEIASIVAAGCRFEHTVHRQVLEHEQLEHVRRVDLEGMSLSIIDMSQFSHIEILNLSDNHIADSHFLSSHIEEISGLKVLDISNNKINKAHTVAACVNLLVQLEILSVVNNPFYGPESSASRLRLLALLDRTVSLKNRLHTLNGSDITIAQKCDAALSAGISSDYVEAQRLALWIERKNLSEFAHTCVLADCRLTTLVGLEVFSMLERLDLRRNSLTNIPPYVMKALPFLSTLDLRHNNFENLEQLMDLLSPADALRRLWIYQAAGEAPPTEFAPIVFRRLFGVEILDDLPNPFPLTKTQWRSIRYLQTRFTGVGPNRLVDINLSNQGILESEFDATRGALSFLPVTRLSLADNPCVHFPNYRFLCIFDILTLEQLDGMRIASSEKDNARSKIKELKKAGKYQPPNVPESTTAVVVNSTMQQTVATTLISGGAVNSGVLSKTESIFSFIQVQAVLISLPEIDWPDLHIDFVKFYNFISLDIDIVFPSLRSICYWDWVKYVGFLLAPLLLFAVYKTGLELDRWRDKCLVNWTRTKIHLFLIWLLLMILAFVFGYSIDCIPCGSGNLGGGRNSTAELCQSFTQLTQAKMPTDTTLGWVIGFAGSFTFFCLLYCIFLNVVRYKNVEESFFYSLRRLKKRASLFLLTLLYLPLARAILNTFRPYVSDTDNVRYVFAFQSWEYPTSAAEIPPFMYISMIFVPIYLFGIPFFFARLAHKGVHEVCVNYRIFDLEQEAVMLRASGADAEQVRQKEEEVRWEYFKALSNYENPQKILYQSYKRRYRFYKLVNMAEKALALLLIVAIATDGTVFGIVSISEDLPLQVIGFAGVIFLFFVFGAVARPFLDPWENFLDLFCRFTNVLNATSAVLFAKKEEWFSEESSVIDTVTWVVTFVNLACLAVILLVLFTSPVRQCVSKYKQRRAKRHAEANPPPRKAVELTSPLPPARPLPATLPTTTEVLTAVSYQIPQLPLRPASGQFTGQGAGETPLATPMETPRVAETQGIQQPLRITSGNLSVRSRRSESPSEGGRSADSRDYSFASNVSAISRASGGLGSQRSRHSQRLRAPIPVNWVAGQAEGSPRKDADPTVDDGAQDSDSSRRVSEASSVGRAAGVAVLHSATTIAEEEDGDRTAACAEWC